MPLGLTWSLMLKITIHIPCPWHDFWLWQSRKRGRQPVLHLSESQELVLVPHCPPLFSSHKHLFFICWWLGLRPFPVREESPERGRRGELINSDYDWPSTLCIQGSCLPATIDSVSREGPLHEGCFHICVLFRACSLC